MRIVRIVEPAIVRGAFSSGSARLKLTDIDRQQYKKEEEEETYIKSHMYCA